MTLLLAPMEGLLDFVLRDILTRVGGVDRCVSEFIRITDTLLPERVFVRYVPELLQGCKTPSGVLVRPQLLGSDSVCLADNAARLAAMGAEGIDLNFGCPSPVVNRHRGGSALLDEPETLYQIVSAVRRAVPGDKVVSAKMRLGLKDDTRAEACALAIEAAGAGELVIHARTKVDGYRPPAYWERIADIKAVVKLPLVANGEIWSVADAKRCQQISGCESLMLGRGMVANPALALAIRGALKAEAVEMSWCELLSLIDAFFALVQLHLDHRQQTGRLKQWLNLLRRNFPQVQEAFLAVRGFHNPLDVVHWLHAEKNKIDFYGEPLESVGKTPNVLLSDHE